MKTTKYLVAGIFVFIFNVLFAENVPDDDFIFGVKCGTFRDARNNSRAHRILQDTTYRQPRQRVLSSPSGRFLIHFDTTGTDKVSNIDLNHNGIPDYVDSVGYYFDYAYQKEVIEMGYNPPPPDSGIDGSDAYDIYVMELGISSGWYGVTILQNQVYPRNNSDRYSSFIEIDNDFSSLDSTFNNSGVKYRTYTDTSYEALKITAVHEFHHAIQFGYGLTTDIFHEMTSTWLEYRVFHSADFMQYVRGLFKDPRKYIFGNGEAKNGYPYSIFAQYMYSKYSDSLIKRFWELIFDGHQGYESLDFAFKERSSTLHDEFCEFLPWLYFTGPRSIWDSTLDKSKYFELASKFPQVKFDTVYTITSSTTLPDIETDNLLPYEFRFLRVLMPSKDFLVTSDTMDIVLVNGDTKSAILQATQLSLPYTLTMTDGYKTGFNQIGTTKYYYQLSAPAELNCSWPYFTKTNQGVNTKVICYAFPNPFNEATADRIYFPATGDAPLGEKILLSLYNSDLNLVYYGKLPVTIMNQNRVLIFDPTVSPTLVNFSSGVYIYKVNGDNEECTGKIAIIKSNK